ncbi:cytochrome P450 [Streptomyces iconiensis]|uniref:Cytochrome P450 n=1 Tax=Streptomyces iconiensis TaxID=1384038 RepID=A0ABT6ZY52_9ACTN|nr:cytochrome P450 [Streptomyces iconiensis]MDJ1133997.1 cytochrome P450 [Streptomyces iconiensis]
MTAHEGPPPRPSVEDGGRKLFSWLKTMRDDHPVWQDEHGVWHVFRYADVQRVITEYEEFSADQTRAVPDQSRVSRGDLTLMDPPDHRKMRMLVSSVFTRRAIDKLTPRITAICAELLKDVQDKDEFDLVRDFAYPLPVTVIAELLGVPAADQPLFREWSETIRFSDGADPNSPELIAAVEGAVTATTEYLAQHCRNRRAEPRDDLISKLVQAEVEGVRMDDEETGTFAGLLLMTGHVTTVVLLANALLCFNESPGVYQELREDRSLIPGAVEEVLRLRAPFMHTKRVAKRPTEVSGVTIPPDQMIEAWLLSANHDEREFAEAERFDHRRDPNPHIGLGRGVHFCLGAPLARLEGQIALNMLMDQFSGIDVLQRRFEPYGWGLSGAQRLLVRPHRA